MSSAYISFNNVDLLFFKKNLTFSGMRERERDFYIIAAFAHKKNKPQTTNIVWIILSPLFSSFHKKHKHTCNIHISFVNECVYQPFHDIYNVEIWYKICYRNMAVKNDNNINNQGF